MRTVGGWPKTILAGTSVGGVGQRQKAISRDYLWESRDNIPKYDQIFNGYKRFCDAVNSLHGIGSSLSFRVCQGETKIQIYLRNPVHSFQESYIITPRTTQYTGYLRLNYLREKVIHRFPQSTLPYSLLSFCIFLYNLSCFKKLFTWENEIRKILGKLLMEYFTNCVRKEGKLKFSYFK